MTVTLDGMIACCFILQFVIHPLTISRQVILRNRRVTAYSIIGDIGLWLFTCLYTAIGVIIIYNSFREKDLRRQFHTEQEVAEHLATVAYLKITFASFIGYTTQLWALKVAYLCYFLNIKKHLSINLQRLLICTSIYAGLGFVVAMGLQLGWCHPIKRNWALDASACDEMTTVMGIVVQAWLNLTADLLILGIAVGVITSLKLQSQERFALFMVAILGSISPAMCIVRFIMVYNTARHPQTSSLSVTREIYLWGTFEVTFAQIAFCLPTFRVLLRRPDPTPRPNVLSSFYSRRLLSKTKNSNKSADRNSLTELTKINSTINEREDPL